MPIRSRHIAGLVSLVLTLVSLGLPATSAAAATEPTSRFGSSINDATDVTRVSGLMGRPMTSGRIFYKGLPTAWSRAVPLTQLPDNGSAVISFEQATPAQLQAFLAGHPPTLTCYVAYFHEPEDDFPSPAEQASYRAAWDLYAPVIRAAGCIPTLILLKWTLMPASGRDWHNWYPAGDVDVLAFDAYNGGLGRPATAYSDPAKFLAPIVAAAREVGLPLGLAEVGAGIIAGDAAGRAAWAHGVAAEAARYPVTFAEWWEGPDGGPFNLDAATAAAWNSDGVT